MRLGVTTGELDAAAERIFRRRIHEPTVASVYDPSAGEPLTAGLVITVEPIIAAA